MKLIVIITTYNRPEMCERLINQVREQTNASIWVFDDGSTPTKTHLPEFTARFEDSIFYTKYNHHGKKNYWKLINKIFRELYLQPFDYVLKLDDDLELAPNAISEAVRIFESLPENKLALNILADNRLGKQSWTGIPSVKMGEYWNTGWVDMIWIANRKFFKKLNWQIKQPDLDIWKENPNASSQVGKQISLRLGKYGGFYQVDRTLVTHGTHDSLMNPEERIKNPLV